MDRRRGWFYANIVDRNGITSTGAYTAPQLLRAALSHRSRAGWAAWIIGYRGAIQAHRIDFYRL